MLLAWGGLSGRCSGRSCDPILHQEDLTSAHKECSCWWGSGGGGEETFTGAPGWGGWHRGSGGHGDRGAGPTWREAEVGLEMDAVLFSQSRAMGLCRVGRPS